MLPRLAGPAFVQIQSFASVVLELALDREESFGCFGDDYLLMVALRLHVVVVAVVDFVDDYSMNLAHS